MFKTKSLANLLARLDKVDIFRSGDQESRAYRNKNELRLIIHVEDNATNKGCLRLIASWKNMKGVE
ncbi:hypothetical protein CS562_27860 [Paenibacillus sp. LK1]|nr:hypothetical protein CS562_27860 [Paenibacillus sp. LK1]